MHLTARLSIGEDRAAKLLLRCNDFAAAREKALLSKLSNKEVEKFRNSKSTQNRLGFVKTAKPNLVLAHRDTISPIVPV